MFEALFRFFFEHSPAMFAQGEIRWTTWTGAFVAVAVTAVAIATALVSYRGSRRVPLRDRLVLTTLRVALLLVVLACLFRPVLVVRAAVPQQNVVGVLLDDSRSMQIADMEGGSRSQFVQSAFGALDSGTLKALADRFAVRVFRFSSSSRARRRRQGAHVRRHRDPPRRLARDRAPGAGRPAAGRAGDGERRRGHGRRGPGRRAAGPQGRRRAGVHRRRRPRDARPGHPDRPGQHAAHGPQGNDAARRRGGRAARVRRPGRDARRRGRGPHRQHAAGDAAGGRRAGHGAGPHHRGRGGPARAAVPRAGARRASSSPRTTSARRSSTCAIAARRSSTSRASRVSS